MAFIKYRHVSIEYFSHLIALSLLTAGCVSSVKVPDKNYARNLETIWEMKIFFAFCNAWTTWIINEFVRVGKGVGDFKFIVDGKINWWLMLSD